MNPRNSSSLRFPLLRTSTLIAPFFTVPVGACVSLTVYRVVNVCVVPFELCFITTVAVPVAPGAQLAGPVAENV